MIEPSFYLELSWFCPNYIVRRQYLAGDNRVSFTTSLVRERNCTGKEILLKFLSLFFSRLVQASPSSTFHTLSMFLVLYYILRDSAALLYWCLILSNDLSWMGGWAQLPEICKHFDYHVTELWKISLLISCSPMDFFSDVSSSSADDSHRLW